MSHGNIRHEKNCLNCGSIVKGPYCHICGQHNVEPQESLLDLLSHFVYDITHFDGKFFKGIKTLLFKPGFLSKEYRRGRRASHINPIRFYVFTSAFFFLIIFSTTSSEDVITFGQKESELIAETKLLREKLSVTKDSASYHAIEAKLKDNDSTLVLYEVLGIIEKTEVVPDSVRNNLLPIIQSEKKGPISFTNLPESMAAYEAEQKALPAGKRDGFFGRYVTKKEILIDQKYHNRWEDFREKFVEKFLHSIPKMMFVSLPLVAFFLWLLYRRKKQFYYANHAILVIHDYIAIYLIILISSLVKWTHNYIHWKLFGLIQVALGLYGIYYVYKSMRVFYEESRGKTLLKYFIFFVLVAIMFSILSVGFVVNSVLQV